MRSSLAWEQTPAHTHAGAVCAHTHTHAHPGTHYPLSITTLLSSLSLIPNTETNLPKWKHKNTVQAFLLIKRE